MFSSIVYDSFNAPVIRAPSWKSPSCPLPLRPDLFSTCDHQHDDYDRQHSRKILQVGIETVRPGIILSGGRDNCDIFLMSQLGLTHEN